MREENGGVDRYNFISWAQTFVLYVSDLTANNRRVLLVYDGYRSHLSLEVLELFRRNHIVVYVLSATLLERPSLVTRSCSHPSNITLTLAYTTACCMLQTRFFMFTNFAV